MNYWLMKSEPGSFSWDDLLKNGSTYWDGVRNYQARNNMKKMSKGDKVLFYHSLKGKEVVGVAKVSKEAYQDPTTDDERWVAVDIVPEKTLPDSVTLKDIKADDQLQEIALIKQSRLSVLPLKEQEFHRILEKAGT